MRTVAPALGSGAYDLLSAAHLLGIDERTLRRWGQKNAAGYTPLLEPTHGWAYSFHDLLSLAVIAVMKQRGVTPTGVRSTIKFLQDRYQVPRPLAHADVVATLATSGNSVLLVAEGTDASRSGQGVLLATVERYLQPIEYGSDRLASLWRPADRVVLDPTVQVGHPCVEGTRITTETLIGRFTQAESAEAISSDLRISVEDVMAAVDFERRLVTTGGLAHVG